MSWTCPVSPNVSSNFPEDGTGHCQLSLYCCLAVQTLVPLFSCTISSCPLLMIPECSHYEQYIPNDVLFGKCMICLAYLLWSGPFTVFFESRKKMTQEQYMKYCIFTCISRSLSLPLSFYVFFLLRSHVLLLRAFVGNLFLLPHEMICDITLSTRTATAFL